MSSGIECACEPRSEDESDAGSLVDFVCSDNEIEEVEEEYEDTPVELVQSAVVTDGVRRSTRNRKVPTRYIDTEYVAMMTDDVDIEAVFSDNECTEKTEGEDDDVYEEDHAESSEESESDEYEEEDDSTM